MKSNQWPLCQLKLKDKLSLSNWMVLAWTTAVALRTNIHFSVSTNHLRESCLWPDAPSLCLLALSFIKDSVDKQVKNKNKPLSSLCQLWSAAATDVTDRRTAGGQASALAAASTCRTAFWEDSRKREGRLQMESGSCSRLCVFVNRRSKVRRVWRSSTPPELFPQSTRSPLHPSSFFIPPSLTWRPSPAGVEITSCPVTRPRVYMFNVATRVVH